MKEAVAGATMTWRASMAGVAVAGCMPQYRKARLAAASCGESCRRLAHRRNRPSGSEDKSGDKCMALAKRRGMAMAWRRKAGQASAQCGVMPAINNGIGISINAIQSVISGSNIWRINNVYSIMWQSRHQWQRS